VRQLGDHGMRRVTPSDWCTEVILSCGGMGWLKAQARCQGRLGQVRLEGIVTDLAQE
jgi:hypothetical protein